MPYSPVALSKTFAAVRTVEDALVTGAPTIGALSRQDGSSKEVVSKLIMAHLVALDAFLKQKDGLTKEEIILIAEEVVDKYPALTFADMHVIFRDAKLGHYGELYNRLTCANVIKWFDNYFDKRCEAAYARNQNADKEAYGNAPKGDGDEILRKLGYKIDDGTVGYDPDVLQAQEQHRREQKSEDDKEADYRRWKANYIRTGQI